MKRTDAPGSESNEFVDKNIGLGKPGTLLEQTWLNNVQEEIANLIESAGITLDGGDKTQLIEALTNGALPALKAILLQANSITGSTIFANTSIEANVIKELFGSGLGTIINDVLLKNGEVSTDKVNEKTPGAGVFVDGVSLKDKRVIAVDNVDIITPYIQFGVGTLDSEKWGIWGNETNMTFRTMDGTTAIKIEEDGDTTIYKNLITDNIKSKSGIEVAIEDIQVRGEVILNSIKEIRYGFVGYNSSPVTEDFLYNGMVDKFPQDGVDYLCTGLLKSSLSGYAVILSRVRKTSATEITFYGARDDTRDPESIVITDGETTDTLTGDFSF